MIGTIRTDYPNGRIEIHALLTKGFSPNERGKIIHKEKDPLLREIWANGYTRYIEDIVSNKVILINDETKYIKEIDLHIFRWCVASLRFKRGANPDGDIHCWVKEADGSAEKFRNLIQAVC